MDKVKESTGMSVLKPIALERLNDPQKKKRVWSDELECWGFFAEDIFSEEDKFLLYCGMTIGDRICVSSSNGNRVICTIVGVWKEKDDNNAAVWKCRLLRPDGMYFDLSVKESILFKEAWR